MNIKRITADKLTGIRRLVIHPHFTHRGGGFSPIYDKKDEGSVTVEETIEVQTLVNE